MEYKILAGESQFPTHVLVEGIQTNMSEVFRMRLDEIRDAELEHIILKYT